MTLLRLLIVFTLMATPSFGEKVRIFSFPPGAYVTASPLAGQGAEQSGLTTTTPGLSFDLAKGPWRLRFALDEHRPATRDIDVRDSSFSVSEVLSKAKATLKVSVTPYDASVWLDGRPIDPLDLPTLLLPPGSYRLRVTRPGYKDYTENFSLADGMIRSLGITLVKAPSLAIDFSDRARRLGLIQRRFEK